SNPVPTGTGSRHLNPRSSNCFKQDQTFDCDHSAVMNNPCVLWPESKTICAFFLNMGKRSRHGNGTWINGGNGSRNVENLFPIEN
ncbi:hypothetical protein, partial [Undibacterium sp. RuRC25W]|uniref:hypothetical protein n=1 Tax=Undibacterium sp. RuRC25W TaxID=3413047 RepID=UPI003BF0EC3F